MRFPSTTRRDGPSGQVGAAGRDLGRQAEDVHRARAGDLHLGAGLSRQCLGNVIGRGRKGTKLWMNFGEIVKAARETTEPAALDQARQGLIDRRPPSQVKEIVGRENAAAPAAAGAPHNPIRS